MTERAAPAGFEAMRKGNTKKELFFRAFLGVVSTLVLPSLALAHLEPIKEAEPNNTPATATPLTSTTTCFAALGEINPKGDVDYFSFTAPAGARLWALLDTSASTASKDSLLTLVGSDGTTQIDQDDDSGVGTNCGMTIGTRKSSAISGRPLTSGGTYYLRVQAADPAWLITLYKLIVVVVTSAATPEVEPNDTFATATSIVVAGSPIGVRQGSARAGEVDYYSVVTTTIGTALEISASGNPQRSGGTKLGLDLLQANGAILMSADNSDVPGEPPRRGVSFCFIVNLSEPYFVRVRGLESARTLGAGAYTLFVAECGVHSMAGMAAPTVAPPRTPAPTISPTLTPRSP